MPALFFTASVFGLYEIACVFKARINPRPNRTCNIKEVDRFKKQAELYPIKNFMRYHRFLWLLGTGGKTCLAGLCIVPQLCIHSRSVQRDSCPPKAPFYTDVGRVYLLNHVFPQLEGNDNSFSSVYYTVLYSKLITKVEEWSK